MLEIVVGMGENTEFLLKLGLEVHVTDIPPKSVKVLVNKLAK